MQNNKQIYINLIVKDLEKSTKFYESLGFIKNPQFSNYDASGLSWSENIMVMLLTEDFARNFTDGKHIADSKKTVAAIFAISFESKAAVDDFATKARAAGAKVYRNKYNDQYDFMYGVEVEDLDGYIWEPTYMDMSKFPQN